MVLSAITKAISGLGGSIITGGASLLGSALTNTANSAQAQRQMDFQSDMSGTSYQRAVADMKAAGINPMLAAQLGGASTPAGASAVMHDPVTPALSSARSTSRVQEELKNLRETNKQIQADTDLKRDQSVQSMQLSNQAISQTRLNEQLAKKAEAETAMIRGTTPGRVGQTQGAGAAGEFAHKAFKGGEAVIEKAVQKLLDASVAPTKSSAKSLRDEAEQYIRQFNSGRGELPPPRFR